MPKPKSKDELLELSQSNFKKLLILADTHSKKEFPEGTLNRNVRDILAHLHQWHLLVLDWYEIGMKGEVPNMPAKGYSWKNMPELNKKIWKDSQNIELDEIKETLIDSYRKVQKITKRHSDEELFTKKKYKWTKSTSLGAYLIANTSSHYDWAIKLIKKAMKK